MAFRPGTLICTQFGTPALPSSFISVKVTLPPCTPHSYSLPTPPPSWLSSQALVGCSFFSVQNSRSVVSEQYGCQLGRLQARITSKCKAWRGDFWIFFIKEMEGWRALCTLNEWADVHRIEMIAETKQAVSVGHHFCKVGSHSFSSSLVKPFIRLAFITYQQFTALLLVHGEPMEKSKLLPLEDTYRGSYRQDSISMR